MTVTPDTFCNCVYERMEALGASPRAGQHGMTAGSRRGDAVEMSNDHAGIDVKPSGEGYELFATWVGTEWGGRNRAHVPTLDDAADLVAAYLADPARLGRIKNGRVQTPTLAHMHPAAEPILDAATIEEMKGWVLDCTWRDIQDESDLEEYSLKEIVTGVHQNVEGGFTQFQRMIDTSVPAPSNVPVQRPDLSR